MDEMKIIISEQLENLQMLMHRAIHQHYAEMHNPHRGQGRVLALLKLKPEISQKELTFLLNMSKQAVAELIAKLEKNGYITREQSTEDKRVMIIKLTEKGAKAGDDADKSELDIEKKLDCFNDDELIIFSEYLSRIISQYEEQFPEEDFEQRRKKMEEFMSSYGHGFKRDHRRHGRAHRGRERKIFENQNRKIDKPNQSEDE